MTLFPSPASSLLCLLRVLLRSATLKADEQFRTEANAAAVDVSLRRLPVHQAQEEIRYALTNQAVSRESISLPSRVSRDDSAHPRDHADPAAVGRAL